MMHGVRIYTADKVWRGILADLGARVLDDANTADINIDLLDIPARIYPIELKAVILDSIESSRQKILNQIFKKPVALSGLQMRIIVLLFQTGGVSSGDLKSILGYSPDIATHTIDTAIYQLRKTFGRDFIKNKDGKYFIGRAAAQEVL
ncbi:MAG: helix-turn-helix domain-containing protein [Rickettsiales bacterium]|jgi:hypothetical protein|nr:helix-turn-helix domain-containing protein [Rickettsiales bacterium]